MTRKKDEAPQEVPQTTPQVETYCGPELSKEQKEALCSKKFQNFLAAKMEEKSHEMSTMAGAGDYRRWALLIIELLKQFLTQNAEPSSTK